MATATESFVFVTVHDDKAYKIARNKDRMKRLVEGGFPAVLYIGWHLITREEKSSLRFSFEIPLYKFSTLLTFSYLLPPSRTHE
jgi:hypothetical protein